ncbi:DUF2726 domain-containing protein [Undibacterium jejuense]|uniref:DUF2726 domain-containing protein n=1 Tax=Undibacterium jejuense TaxID=1344949 RepID=A0A923HFQ4_9BURK|nr:DUF2726 domain-containing protein [Undibacterium jejuense]MBC3862195.1 DUF2726 domain-containing protein [Undibacterium jejuense]
MKFLALIALAVLAILAIAINNRIKSKSKKTPGDISKKLPLTKNEQPMYFRLAEALPEYVVLAQVAFSALLQTKNRATRNKFDRKVADFVVCTKAFEVLAIVELDDSSHKGREEQDRARDSLLTNAGYRVARYARTPDVETIKRDITGHLLKPNASLSNEDNIPERVSPHF